MAADRSPAIGVLEFGRAILHDEARALDALADELGAPFENAVDLICACRGKLIVSGLGKSGHVARKIAATFASTGTTAVFLHLAEAIHGDLGMAAEGDIAILISQSGETAELEPVIDHFQLAHIPIIAITGHAGTMLEEAGDGVAGAAALARSRSGIGRSDDLLDHGAGARRRAGDDGHAAERRDPHRFRPASSRRIARREAEARAAGDARRQIAAADARGQLDARHGRRDVRQTARRRRCDRLLGYLIGVITDGDLRRNIERGLEHSAGEFMTRDPKTVGPDDLIDDALVLFDEYKITALFVVKEDGRGKKPVGVLHIHDCPAAR